MNRVSLPIALLAVSAASFVAAAAGMTIALTASNTVPATRAGSGTTAIGTFTNSAFDYTLNDTSPQNVDQATFTQAPGTADSVRMEWNGTSYACTNAAGAVTCATTVPQATITAAPTVRVVGAS